MRDNYIVKDIYTSIQGEGSMTGQVATFVRFVGCNVGYGVCDFCDTDWMNGKEMTSKEIASNIDTKWIWFTGGEPMLQLNQELLEEFYYTHNTAIETNGSVAKTGPLGITHTVLSPKVPRSECKIYECSDLKIIEGGPVTIEEYADFPATNRYIQPRWNNSDSLQMAINYVERNPSWRLSIQAHKYIGER